MTDPEQLTDRERHLVESALTLAGYGPIPTVTGERSEWAMVYRPPRRIDVPEVIAHALVELRRDQARAV